MNLYFRLLFLLIKRKFHCPKMDIFEACRTRFRVWPNDLDINFHMNNGRYLTLMDLGRVDMMLKAGIFGKLINQGFYPVVVSQSIRFKKSLAPFQRFELVTQLEGLDDRDFYISQKFYHGETLYAEGYIKGRFKKRGQQGSVRTSDLFKAVGLDYNPTPLSDKAQAQSAIEAHLTT